MSDDTVGGMPADQLSGETTVGNGQTQEAAKQTEKQGEKPADAQATIDWAKIPADQIPAEVLKNHPLFKQERDENIRRRQENKRLKAALASEDGAAGAEPEEKPEPKDKIDLLYEEWQQFKQEQAKSQAQTLREQIAVDAGLPKDWAVRLIGKTEAELRDDAKALAATLPQKRNFGSDTSPANFGNADAQEALTTRVKEKLTQGFDITKPSGVFAPGVHRQKGGGPLR